jgi:hypothetical protein
MTRTRSEPVQPEAPSTAQIDAHRKKQAEIHEALNKVFGPFEESDPRKWKERTFLHLVGLVYTRLSASVSPIPTDELGVLAKLLAEERLPAGKPGRASSNRASGGQNPPTFAEIVRQVYGVSIQDKGVGVSSP